MHVPLRGGDGDACFTEQIVYAESDLTAHASQVHHLDHVDPEVHLEHKRVVLEVVEDHYRLRILQDPGMLIHHALNDLCDAPCREGSRRRLPLPPWCV